jgi:hypothetical protein
LWGGFWGGGFSIDGGETFSGDFGGGFSSSGLLGGPESTVECPDNACKISTYTTVTTGNQVVASYSQLRDFRAFANGAAGYYAYFGPGSLYDNPDRAGRAAGLYFGDDSIKALREFGGTVSKDASGFFTYALDNVGPQCSASTDCAVTVMVGGNDVAPWHDHPISGDVTQFIGDRIASIPYPVYVTTLIGSDYGTFRVSPWPGGLLGDNLPANPAQLSYPNITPMCSVGGPSFPGISPCR